MNLPGIKDPERARKLLQSTAQLEFWETYEYNELFQGFESANAYLRDVETANASTEDTTEEVAIVEEVKAEELLRYLKKKTLYWLMF